MSMIRKAKNDTKSGTVFLPTKYIHSVHMLS